MQKFKIRCVGGEEIEIEAFYLMTYSKVLREMISTLGNDQDQAVQVDESQATWSWLTLAMTNGGDVVTSLSSLDHISPILRAIDKYDINQLKTRMWRASQDLLAPYTADRDSGALAVRLAKLAAQDDQEELFRRCVRSFCPSQLLQGRYEINARVYCLDFKHLDDIDADILGGKYVRALGKAVDAGRRDKRGMEMNWDAVAEAIQYRPRPGHSDTAEAETTGSLSHEA